MLPRDLVARAACVVLAAILGCARSMPPPGGPLDTTPPRVMAVTPADSSVGVSRSGGVEFLFSEAMDRASVRDNVKVYPPPGLPSYQWHGRRFRLEWGESLGANATYQVFLSGRARDLRGVPMGAPAQVRFSTGAALAPGRIDGVLRAKTLGVNGVRILVFADSTHGLPDTTRALEPLYETETDTIGAYAFVGLPLAESFSVHAFYDRNADEFLDPEQDVLATHAGSVRLTPDRTLPACASD